MHWKSLVLKINIDFPIFNLREITRYFGAAIINDKLCRFLVKIIREVICVGDFAI